MQDPTGARRLWPVACRGMIDLAGLEEVRDQLWAEAVHRFKAGEPWWLETPELEALATAEQEVRFVVDPGRTPIVSGWGTAPTSASRRCSNTCSGSLRSSVRSLLRPGSQGFWRTGWDSKSIDRGRKGTRESVLA